MTSSTTLSPQYRAFRLLRSPIAVVAVVLVYTAALLAFREGDDGIGFTALRGPPPERSSEIPHDGDGGGDDETVDREVVEEWDPLPPSNFPERGPVKGGVEVYPLQPARRVRKATTPLVPAVAEIEGTLTAWKLPEEYTLGGGEAIKGLYVLFHGCHHGPLDWFDLPEERAIVGSLVKAGYAVVAPASKDRVSGCWKYNTGDGDINPVKAVLWRWYRDWSISPTTPLFLYGVSSGGNMATLLASRGGFQLCDKRTTYVQVSGVMSQVSWGVTPSSYGRNCPPLAFMPMPKGDVDTGDGADTKNVPAVFGNSRKIPAQISSIAHYVRKSGGRPRMLLLPLGELSLYRAFFSDRVYEVSSSQSATLYNALLATHAINCNSRKLVGGEPECFLTANPREDPLALDTLVATYMATLGAAGSGPESEFEPTRAGNGNGTAVPGESPEVIASPQVFNRRGQEQGAPGLPSGPLPILQPAKDDRRDDLGDDSRSGGRSGAAAGGDVPGGALKSIAAEQRQPQGEEEEEEEKPAMAEDHATEVFRELLNVAWGAHEISADFVKLWEDWLWESCGDNCRPWPSR